MNNYDDIQSILLNLSADSSAPQCHGELCGWLCVNTQLSYEQWQSKSFAQANDLDAGQSVTLTTFFGETKRQILESDFSFSLLLPNDTASLHERLDALGEWCQGFLVGISHSGLRDLDQLPAEAYEAINDMMEITQIDPYSHTEAGDLEEAEHQWMELSEYVRMSTLVVSESLRESMKMQQANTMH